MIELIYLQPGEEMPEMSDDEPWLIVEASDDGRFFGTGWARPLTGEDVFFVSLPEDDVSLDAAVAAARNWADERAISTVWVQTTPA